MKDTVEAKALRLAIYKDALKLMREAVERKNTYMVGFCFTMHWSKIAYQEKYGVLVPKFDSKSSVKNSDYPEKYVGYLILIFPNRRS